MYLAFLIGSRAAALARRLRRASPKTGRRRSLRKIAAELAEAGVDDPFDFAHAYYPPGGLVPEADAGWTEDAISGGPGSVR